MLLLPHPPPLPSTFTPPQYLLYFHEVGSAGGKHADFYFCLAAMHPLSGVPTLHRPLARDGLDVLCLRSQCCRVCFARVEPKFGFLEGLDVCMSSISQPEYPCRYPHKIIRYRLSLPQEGICNGLTQSAVAKQKLRSILRVLAEQMTSSLQLCFVWAMCCCATICW